MSGQAQTAHNELIDELNQVFTNPDDFSIRKLERKAEDLLKVSAAEGYMVLGGLSALRKSFEGMHDNHKRCLKLTPHDGLANYNYAVSLEKCGFVKEAAHYAEVAYNLGYERQELPGVLVQANIASGRVIKAYSLLSAMKIVPEGFDVLPAAVEFMKSNGYSDDDFSLVASQAESVITENKLSMKGVGMSSLVDEVVCIDLFVSERSSDEVADLNVDLAMRLAALELRPGVVTSCVFSFRSQD